MTNETRGAVDSSLHEGLPANQVLGIGAVSGLVGWLGTQYVAWNPGLGLETVGVEGTTVVVLCWALAVLAMVGVVGGAGARSVSYSPLIWFWSGLLAIALSCNVAVVTGLVPDWAARYLLWHPWIAVYILGYLVTGVVALDRSRIAYLCGSLLGAIALLAWLLFPLESSVWLFALTGIVHAGPLAADAFWSPVESTTTERPTATARNP